MADQEDGPTVEHLNVKVTNNNNEVFFKVKQSTQLKKLMDAICERQGKRSSSVRFLFDGTRKRPENMPDTVGYMSSFSKAWATSPLRCLEQITDGTRDLQLEMTDGDTLEVHQAQIGG
jgi:hypothetical protein